MPRGPMAAAWARAKRALATGLCVGVPARQRAFEDAPPVVEAPSSVAEDKLESAPVSVRRLTSFGSRSSQQVGIHRSSSSFFFLLFFFPVLLDSCGVPDCVCGELEMRKKCLLCRWTASGFWEISPCKIPTNKDGGFGLVLVKQPR